MTTQQREFWIEEYERLRRYPVGSIAHNQNGIEALHYHRQALQEVYEKLTGKVDNSEGCSE